MACINYQVIAQYMVEHSQSAEAGKGASGGIENLVIGWRMNKCRFADVACDCG